MIFVIILITGTGASVRYTSEDIREVEEASTKMEEPRPMAVESQSSSFATVSSDGGPRVVERQYYQPGEPVKIKKRIYPLEEGGYLPGDPIIVYVELVPMVKDIKDLWVHEFIDERLNQSTPQYISNIYRLDQAEQIRECRENASERCEYVCRGDINCQDNISFYESEESHLKTKGKLQLNKHQRLIYWYSIRPNEPGVYTTETSLRFYDSWDPFPDMDYTLNIIVNEPSPRYELGVTANKNKVSKYSGSPNSLFFDPLNIIYDIRYLGGAGNETNVTIILDDMGHYSYVNATRNKSYKLIKNITRNNKVTRTKVVTEYEPDTNLTITCPLKLNETINISKNIIFHEDGLFSLPSITINGERKYFKDDEIVVETWFQRNKDYLLLGMAIVGLIFGNIFKRELRRLLRLEDEK